MSSQVPQIISSDSASGAQVIDGSLKFDPSKYLTRSFGSGNRKKWTWAAWVKRYKFGAANYGLFSYYPGSGNGGFLRFSDDDSGDTFRFYDTTNSLSIVSKEKFRDTEWYHIVIAADTTQGTDTDRVKRYVNGVQQTVNASNTWPGLNDNLDINNSGNHFLGKVQASAYGPVAMSNVYFIDGLALGPEEFGFTDPLTNTWRPKKYTVPLLETTDNSVTVASAGGAKPILNTTDAYGQTLGSGVATHPDADDLELCIPCGSSAGKKLNDENPTGRTSGLRNIASNPGSNDTSIHKYYGGSLKMASGAEGTFSTDVWDAIKSSQFTVEMWIYLESTSMSNGYGATVISSRAAGDNSNAFFHVGWTGVNGVAELYFNINGGYTHYVHANNNYGTSPYPVGEWHHVASTRDGSNVVRTYLDGTMIGKTTDSTTIHVSRGLFGGHDYGNFNSYQTFYLCDLRIYSVAKYYSDSGFTIPKVDITSTGLNNFYLPLDGNSPIGEDKSGNGNHWTPVNFGGSVELDNPQVSGARPVLNTTQGGTQAGVGVFGSRENKFYTVTTANGSVYQFDITSGDNPSLSFIRGATYRFDYSSHTGHPVLFSSTNPDSSTTAYTDGTSTASNVISFTVPHNAPDTLYYYCQNHPTGMNGSISVTTDETKADLYAWKNVLALPLVGSKDDVSNQLNSLSATKVTASTNAVASSASSNFYGGSWYFDGSGDYLDVTESNNCFDFGTGDFTIELWAYLNNSCDLIGTANNSTYLGSSKSGWIIRRFDSGIKFGYQSNSSWVFETTFGAEGSRDKWNHIAITREGNQLRCFSNGIQQGSSVTNSTDFISTEGYCRIGGGYGSTSLLVNGYIQDVRIFKGVAKYTSNFVVPATSPDILPDTPSGVATKSKLKKITDGAVSFDGSGDSLQVIDSSDLAFGTGEFTVEMFFYANTVSGNDVLYDSRAATGNPTDGFSIVRNGDQLRTYTSGAYQITPSTFRVGTKRWYHLAITRESTTQKMYIDGELVGSATVSNDFSQNKATIGSDVNKSENWDGFISNVRLIKGTALYTSKFTPPTAPLTNVTNTKLLCCQSPSNVKLSPVAPTVGTTANTRFNSNFESIPTTVNSLTVTNNGSVSTTSAGTNSYGFTNCADLSGSNSLSVNLGAIPQVSTYDIIFKVTGTTDNKYLFAISNTGLVRRTGSSLAWYNNNGDQTISTTPDDGEWHHLRVTPKSLYFDGVETQTTSTNPNIVVTSNGYMALGAYRNDSGTIQYNGAVDIGLVRVMPGVDLGAPSSIPITTNGTLSSTETIPNDGVIFAAANSAATTFNPFNTSINTVRGQETGYPTLNPFQQSLNSTPTISNGNLTLTKSAGSSEWTNTGCTMTIPKSGKWFWEITWTSVGGGSVARCGVADSNDYEFNRNTSGTGLPWLGSGTGTSWSCDVRGYKYNGGTETTGYLPAFVAGDVMGIILDRDNNTITYTRNGVSGGVAHSNVTPEFITPGFGLHAGTTNSFDVNFGQKPFKFPPPDGFQPLNDANVRPETVVPRSDQYVGVTTYIGNGSTKSVSGLNFGTKPDFVWIKSRDNTGGTYAHMLFDSVRGSEYSLNSDGTGASVINQYGKISSFDLNGFTVAPGSSDSSNVNTNTDDLIAWCWRAGGNKNTFNVDDVGYASASDVNMNVDALSNKTQDWSGNSTGGANADRAFDGTGPRKDHYSHDSGSLTVNFSPAISGRIIVYGGAGGSGARTFTLSDGSSLSSDVVYTTSPYYSTLDFGVKSNITSLTCSNGYTLYAIVVDGKLLIDDDVSVNAPSIAPVAASVGTKQGFSIIQYQGNGSRDQSIPHGLTQAPDFSIIKNMDGTNNWTVFHRSVTTTNQKVFYLNTQAAIADYSNGSYTWWNRLPGVSLFYIGDLSTAINNGTNDMISYHWHNVPGLQKFGKYIGNANADGPFIELGFRPSVIIIKRTDGGTENWTLWDASRNTTNVMGKQLYPNLNNAEADAGTNTSYGILDFVSNGVKIRGSHTSFNSSGHTFIYAAWAEAPESNLYGATSNAR